MKGTFAEKLFYSRYIDTCSYCFQNNQDLVKLILKHGGSAISTDTNDKGQNVLHILAAHCVEYNSAELLDIFMVRVSI